MGYLFSPDDPDPRDEDAPETIEVNGIWYDRRDTVDALNGLLADARFKLETYKSIIREYRQRDLAANSTLPPQSRDPGQ